MMTFLFFCNDEKVYIDRKILTLFDIIVKCGGLSRFIIFMDAVLARNYY
jgi:hypothetical protein